MISGSTEVGVGDTKSQKEEAERHQEVGEAQHQKLAAQARHQEVGEARHQKLATQEQHPGVGEARHQRQPSPMQVAAACSLPPRRG